MYQGNASTDKVLAGTITCSADTAEKQASNNSKYFIVLIGPALNFVSDFLYFDSFIFNTT